MSAPALKPLVGVICDIRRYDLHEYHTAGDKYLLALTQAADVVPVLIPAMADELEIEQWLSRVDGVFLTGAYSMADPALYGEEKIDRPYEYDARRDAQAAALIHALRAADKPLLGVCRGMQDMNVALGGSLYQAVHDEADLSDHREDKEGDIEIQYGPVHDVTLVPGGLLHHIVDRESIRVNSLHSQGIRRLADDLQPEAIAEDSLIEAISVKGMTFGLGVQWHPEWRVNENPTQKLIFEAFGQACRASATKV
ncbi:gamma-glutamyl-gamma-aminobutyrate hydrolase family protein [Pseudomaricurvus sp. HS19]|uniref:gamma-glutamyl-gamma-aminobutyrate hydrolase family protein n=1 Tax=Pseudomaricurvus sp. HS19 TaxID=2692626 RepID=UPI0013687E8E|nr:gamma-glutamyl-gamma-aminobutyrate hydrolase family protein [Pseudomaricurvus sp. HS19]MYM64816.1 gamma-glutamyl-gamma-aminobutyrate hydrolase family protein [Pseudomaricurvus sp. HS19]